MSSLPRVLLVFKTATIGKLLFGWFADAGYDVALVTSFESAKAQLQSELDLLVSEIRLGDYNGLHLASRAQARQVPAIVLGDADVVLERDAQHMEIPYVQLDVDRDYLLTMAAHLTADRPERSYPEPVSLPTRSRRDRLAFVSSADLVPVSARDMKLRTRSPLYRINMN